jgi:thiamine kinase-like enzyme
MIPKEKQAVVSRALNKAFGVDEYDDITLLTGGLSPALVYRITVKGRPYMLRLIMREDQFADPARLFAIMNTAGEAGISPQIRFASVEDKILITDFVEAKPYPDDMAVRIAGTIRKLHTLKDFPAPKMGNYIEAMNVYVQQFRSSNTLPESDAQELFRRYDDMLKVYPRNEAELVASHNDLKPQNMVWDGEQVWLIDWEAAFLNDEYVDLGVVANFFARDDAQEEAILAAYLGESAGAYRRARFFLMRQMLSLFYVALLMVMAAKMGTPIDPDLSAPDFRDFHDRLISGEVTLVGWDERVKYAKVHLNELMRNIRSQRFDEALALVGDPERA